MAEATLTWAELRPYEQQQGGYWLYPEFSGPYGEGKEFIRVPRPSGCVCMQAWSSVTGRTCPVHGYSAPMQITC